MAPAGIVLRMGGGALPRLSHALHIDIDQLAQLRNQLGHVHAGAAVDRGRILPGEQGDSKLVSGVGGHSPHRVTAVRKAGKGSASEAHLRFSRASCRQAPADPRFRRMAARPKVLAIVLAGGEGKRLMPLTVDRAKPAVPFGGTYRLIDFVLSNLANAGMRQIAVLTQYKSHSLDRHISLTWRMSTMLGNYVTPVPAQQRLGPRWYQGSADAIYQSMNLFVDEDPDYVVVFGADNIYRMDVEQMLEAHIDGGLGATVAGIRVPRSQATAFGVIDADRTTRSKSSWRSRPNLPGCRTTQTCPSPRWATTSSPATPSSRH